MGRIEEDKIVVTKMLSIYCRAHHGKGYGLCDECSGLREYALSRLELCPFGEDKPACKRCDVHCFEIAVRERIREVMRFSGPRMLFYDAFSWLEHYLKRK
ncbi:MAG: nitrous oxide-stimulated promoter family protein [bacterium]|nr:nitrous oxide-stimulated promoter family protein [bacterium]